jgi:predicted RNA-binding Zn ribbon-like protein
MDASSIISRRGRHRDAAPSPTSGGRSQLVRTDTIGYVFSLWLHRSRYKIRMTTPARPPPFFIGDHLGLDFLNTLAVPVDTEVEWLASGQDLLTWLKKAELVPASVLQHLRKHALPGELDAIAAQARALRFWFRPLVDKFKGKPLPASVLPQLEPLNQLLRRDEEFGQIVVADQQARQHRRSSDLVWRRLRRWDSPESLLFPIARSLADLICQESFSYIKACEGPTCTLLFIDRTRGHARRWCSMAVCGNRAKQDAYRTRAYNAQRRKE